MNKKDFPFCPYCSKQSVQTTGEFIYPHRKDLYDKIFYYCEPCNAYVGCHPNSDTPLGVLANAELRKFRSLAHAVFDPIWLTKKMSRHQAYVWLAKQLEISLSDCHIGHFDTELCRRTVMACKTFISE